MLRKPFIVCNINMLYFVFSAVIASWMVCVHGATSDPTGMPTGMPTSMPTSMPVTTVSNAPTSYPTVSVGSPVIVFDSTLSFSGVSAEDMDADEVAQETAIETTAESMGNGVTPNMLSYGGANDTSTRRLLRDGSRMLVTSCDVIINANIPISAVGGSASAAYSAVTTSLTTAVTNGDFTTTLQANAAANGDTTVASASATGVTDSTYVETVSTQSPSAAPTSKSSSGDDDQAAVIGGSVAGAVVVLGVGGYFVMNRGKQEEGLRLTKAAPSHDVL